MPILYILSGNLSTTPRALKSILLHTRQVEILLVSRTTQWESMDDKLIDSYNLRFTSLPLYRKPFLPWFIASLKQEVARLLYPLLKKSIRINSFASEKASILLHNQLKSEPAHYSAVMGHGYGALYPSWKVARIKSIPFFFDMEDFHPGEPVPGHVRYEKSRRSFLIKKLLPDAHGITFSSPLIRERTLDLLSMKDPGFTLPTILNSFHSSEFFNPKPCTGAIKLVWFSQRIAPGRGLEEVFKALGSIDEEWELFLIGEADMPFLDAQVSDTVLAKASRFRERIQILGPRTQQDLHASLAGFDVGLAVEPGLDENRKLCITNKLVAYAQAGLYILASDTPAQVNFMMQDPALGMLTPMDPGGLSTSFHSIIKNKDEIRATAVSRYGKAGQFSWEQEAEKLSKCWNGQF